MKTKPTTMRFTPQDKQAIETIKELYGCPSDVAAIRLAIRMVARQEVRPDAPAPASRNGPSLPMAQARGFTGRFDKLFGSREIFYGSKLPDGNLDNGDI